MDFLKSIFGDKSFTFDDLVQAINAHNGDEANKENQVKIGNLGGGEYVSKAKHDALQALLDGKTTELDTANGLIAELKKGTKGNEELQGKGTAYESQVATLQAELLQTRIDNAVQLAIRDAKGLDTDYLTFKLKEQGELALDDDGKIKGIDERITQLKTQFPNQFEATAKKIIAPQPLPNPNHGRETEPQSLADAIAATYNENK